MPFVSHGSCGKAGRRLKYSMRCAVYARYSSDLQRDRSIEDQIRNCRQHAVTARWTILDEHIYSDRAVSGTTLEGRASVESLMAAAHLMPRPFDYVLVDDTSRLSRDRVDQAQIVRDLKDLGIFVFFVSDRIDSRDETTEDVILPVFGIKDSLYCRDLARKTKRGMAGQVLNGFSPGGRTYGYKYEPIPDPSGAIDRKTRLVRSIGTRISVGPEEARVVQSIFSLYAAGHGLKSIAMWLNEQGIDPPGRLTQIRRGRLKATWCPNAIRAMLRNPKYIGDWTWNKTQYKRIRKTGKRIKLDRPKKEWVEYINPDLAIVDGEMWELVYKRHRDNARTYAKGERAPHNSYMMSGLVKCSICGASYIAINSGSRETVRYGCSSNWHRGHKACPNNIRIRRAELENRVLDAIKNRLLNPDIIAVLVQKVNLEIKQRLTNTADERDVLEKRISKVAGEIQNLVNLVATTGKVGESVRDGIDSRESELRTLRSQLAALRTEARFEELEVKPGFIVRWIRRLDELLNADPLQARQEIGNIIGTLIAAPVSHHGKPGVMLHGKPKVEGIIGVVSGVSTLSNGGGWI